MTPTMQAIELDAYGGPEQYHLREVPRPSHAQGQVLIRVKFASVNAMDAKMASGQSRFTSGHFPLRLGADFSGLIAESGENLPEGTEVFGRALGSYAGFVVADPDSYARKPPGLSLEAAAALPVAGVTAWQAIYIDGQLRADQRVLIQGASGGVGHLAVQLAKQIGAHVIGTASPQNAAFVKSLGADEVLDYRQPLAGQTRDLDLVIDGHGAESQAQAYALMRPGGLLISLVGPPPPAPPHLRTLATSANINRDSLTAVGQAAEQGVLEVTIAKVFPLAEAGAAQAYGRSGAHGGKVLLQP